MLFALGRDHEDVLHIRAHGDQTRAELLCRIILARQDHDGPRLVLRAGRLPWQPHTAADARRDVFGKLALALTLAAEKQRLTADGEDRERDPFLVLADDILAGDDVERLDSPAAARFRTQTHGRLPSERRAAATS